LSPGSDRGIPEARIDFYEALANYREASATRQAGIKLSFAHEDPFFANLQNVVSADSR
jgi:hypothetical protein